MDGIRHGAAAPPMIRCGAAAPHEVRGGRVVAGSIAARGGRVEAESATVAGQVALRFTGGPHFGSHVNLTAVRADGAHLWVAGDETATLERLVLDAAAAPTRAGRQRSFRLADLVQLPGPANGEADIEGIARAGGWLWAIGSHALVRRRPKPVHDEEKVVRRLGKLRRDPNRYVIVRLAVQLGVDRRPEPVRVSRDGRRSALVGAPGAENLLDLLRADTHLAPFLAIPARDNGIDVQGLAVVGDRLYVGLRGPVLRGWAVVLEVLPGAGPDRPRPAGVGDLPGGCALPEALPGARRSRRARPVPGRRRPAGARGADDGAVGARCGCTGGGARRRRARWCARRELPVETVVPHGEGTDHAEGITLLAGDPQRSPRAAARGLRHAGPGPPALAGHAAGRPGADRGRPASRRTARGRRPRSRQTAAGTPESDVPESDTGEDDMPEDDIPEATCPEDDTAEDDIPEDVPDDAVPRACPTRVAPTRVSPTPVSPTTGSATTAPSPSRPTPTVKPTTQPAVISTEAARSPVRRSPPRRPTSANRGPPRARPPLVNIAAQGEHGPAEPARRS